MNRRILVMVLGSLSTLSLLSCGSYSKSGPPSGLTDRVLVSQGVSSSFSFGSLRLVNGFNDTIARTAPLSAGSSPGLMAMSPTRNLAAAVDASSNTVYLISTASESSLGNVKLSGPTTSMVFPTAQAVGFAAVPTATVNGYSFIGAVYILNFSTSVLTPIAVPGAQTVVADSTGTQVLAFSNDSDSVTLLTPGGAVPPVDTSCLPQSNPPNAVCTIIPGFNRPVYAIVSGTTAYILNCGFQCGGSQQASVQTLDLSTLAVGTPLLVNGATWGLISGSSLLVAGTGTPTGPLCSSLDQPTPPQTAATYCGTLDIVDLTTMTDPYYNNPATEIAITDGYHDRMDLTTNGEVFVGSHDCTNIGDVSNPVGEVRGCLAIYNTLTKSVIIPPDNGDVNGLQGFTTRSVEYVAEGGSLRVYDTITNILLINDFLPEGTIDVVGYVGDVKAIDFF